MTLPDGFKGSNKDSVNQGLISIGIETSKNEN